MRLARSVAALLALAPVLAAQAPADRPDTRLDNGLVQATFDARGLVQLREVASGAAVDFAGDDFAAVLGDRAVEGRFLAAPAVERADGQVTFRFTSGDWRLAVDYELRAGWHFVGKQLTLQREGLRDDARAIVVHRLEPLRLRLPHAPTDSAGIRSGALLRYAGDGRGHTLFVLLQNPFGQWQGDAREASLGYAPQLPVLREPLRSDRVCLGVVPRSGHRQPATALPEWQWLPAGTPPTTAQVDDAETAALVGVARTFLEFHPQRSTRVHIGWCENDYQIDIGTEAGRREYERILLLASEVGCRHVLFTPANDALAAVADNKDAWSWENVLWLGLGQKIRQDLWQPGRDPLPASVQTMLDRAKSLGLAPLAYVYPTMPWLQQKEWTAWIRGEPGGYRGADSGVRSFQDWLVAKLTTFARSTGVAGFSFDHWWIAYDDASSRYAQWDGCRRVLSQLRRNLPDLVIDGRQQYHGFGVWTWLAGSYPHPLASDEQPESFRSFPDLHWDRASADRQRRTAYGYRTREFVPVEIMPGYLSHQTPRLDEKGDCPRVRFRPRDFDLLGFRYSVISAIATAPFQLVVNFLPARDEQEFAAFGAADRQWLRGWFDWTDQHLDILRHTRPILGDVQLGRVDGNAACRADQGFVFLFNPNYRALPASFVLDERIGLTAGEHFVLRQLYPDAERGRCLAPASGSVWRRGDTVAVAMPGAEALVLAIEPVPAAPVAPRLAGAAGSAHVADGELVLADVVGECGTLRELRVTLPAATPVRACRVNGVAMPFAQDGAEVTVRVRFGGAAFARCQQVGTFDPAFAGGRWSGRATVPARVFAQLAARRRAWPVDYDADDLRAGYLGSHRLLLFVNVAEPDDAMAVRLSVDGAAMELRPAWSSIVRSNPKNTFVGWFADLSALAPDVEHTFALELPALAPGQFQGVFFDTVVTETTGDVRVP